MTGSGGTDDDVDFLSNYRTDHLYVHPDRKGTGAYATLVAENEEFVFETEITERARLAVKLFYLDERRDFNTVKLTKIRRTKVKPDPERAFDRLVEQCNNLIALALSASLVSRDRVPSKWPVSRLPTGQFQLYGLHRRRRERSYVFLE